MYSAKFENVPDIFWAPGRALVMVAVKKLARLGFLVLVLVLVINAPSIPNRIDVRVTDPSHNSVFVHVFS